MIEELGLDGPPEPPPPAEYKTAAAILGLLPSRGKLITLAGAPWVGKTSLLMTMARYHAIVRQRPAVFVSAEYPEEVVRDRLLAGLAGVSVHRVQRWNLPVRERRLLDEAREKMSAAAGLRLISARSISLETLKDQLGEDLENEDQPALFVDGLQALISAARWSRGAAPEHDEDECRRDCPVDHVADGVLRELKLLAMGARIPLVVTSSLATQPGERRPERLDVTDEVEQWSDALVLLHRASQRSFELNVQVCNMIDFGMDWPSTLQLQGHYARAVDADTVTS